MRALASIQRITNIGAIPDADKIECATILGWQVVVKKDDNLRVGDLVVYCEIDSLFPVNEDFKFLEPLGMRIKTQRLRGQISQGICFPLSILEKYGLSLSDIQEGMEVTDTLGVTKFEYQLAANLLGEAKGCLPSRLRSSEIIRIQNAESVLNKYQGTRCYETEKLDGESITFYVLDNVFGVCSKGLDFIESPESLHWQIARRYDMEAKLRTFGRNISMQGEIIGDGIKGNKYKLKGKEIRLYNIFEVDKYSYFNLEAFKQSMKELKLESVPILSEDFILSNDIQELVTRSVGRSALADTQREGIIITPVEEIYDMIGRIILKVISPKFLIKHGE